MNDTFILTVSVKANASREKVWSVWTDSAKIAKWWGPEGFQSTVEELDVRDGGKFRVIMHGPDGKDYPNIYVFDEVRRPNQLIYTNEGSKQFGLAPFQSVVDFEDEGGKTKITLKMRFTSQEEKDKHINQFHADEGSRQILERLARQAEA